MGRQAEPEEVFPVIAPSYDLQVRLQTMELKHDSGTDTGMTVITAGELKWVAETWPKHSVHGKLSLKVFNMTGILDRATLEERLAVLLRRRRRSHGGARNPDRHKTCLRVSGILQICHAF